MNFNFYFEKLEDSEEFQEFLKENSDAFFSSAFFIIDRENLKTPDNKNHLDFFVPSKNELYSFQLEEGVKKVKLELPKDYSPKKIHFGEDFDFDEVEDLIREKMGSEDIKNKLQKILISMQNVDRKDYLICTVFISGFGMLKVRIFLDKNGSKKIEEFEKKSFLDMMNVFKKK